MTVPWRGGYGRRDHRLLRFSARASLGLGLERSPGSIVTTPARSVAWPYTAPCTRRDCTPFQRNIPSLYGMWLVTLFLLYSFQEGTWRFICIGFIFSFVIFGQIVIYVKIKTPRDGYLHAMLLCILSYLAKKS